MTANRSPESSADKRREDMASYDDLPWVLVRLRKTTTCALTQRRIEPGEWAWRPLTNGGQRMKRIAKGAMPAKAIGIRQPTQGP
jgi:hypothetical protein